MRRIPQARHIVRLTTVLQTAEDPAMYCLIYFDTEDFFSPPDSPVHRLPGQMAEIMTKHGLPGCFHIHGECSAFRTL